jgi:hypothetical protein
VFAPFPRVVSAMPSGPITPAGRPGFPGAVQTANVQAVVAVADQSLAAGT